MGKTKKLDTKLRLYYKGPLRKPTKVASEEEMQVIKRSFIECLPVSSKTSFKATWMGHEIELQMVVGLKSSLRYFKRGHTKAVIFDDTATGHISGYLIEFANKLNIPVVQASKLVLVAPEVNLNTLLVVSLVDVAHRHNEAQYKDGDPKPRAIDSCVENESFNDLVAFLQSTISYTNDKYIFKVPETVQVKSTGKSEAKKGLKRGEKQSRRLQNIKTKQEEQTTRGES